MFKNYIIIAWRNLLKHKGDSFINIAGLAVGLAAFIMISIYIQHELSFDTFNVHLDRIYRISNDIKFGDNHVDLAVTSPLVGVTAQREIPAVEKYTRLRWHGSFLVKNGSENVRETNIAWADSTLFEIFTLPVIAGDSKTALKEPGSIVINETLARKYFNSTEVIGKTLTINNREQRKITAVIKDIPENSHFRFTCFIPNTDDPGSREDTWAGNQNWNTFILVRPGTDANALTVSLNKMYDKYLEPQLKAVTNQSLADLSQKGDFFKFNLTPLKRIHLHSDKIGELYGRGSLQNIYIFSAVAFFILIIACINFMNLSTASSAGRSREVGIRKVLGSHRSSLAAQFISESLMTVGLAMLVAIGIIYLAMPGFNELIGKSFSKEILFTPQWILPGVCLLILVGLLAGSYPAYYLSSFIPIKVLKNSMGSGAQKSRLRNVLVVFQFASSIILIAGTFIVYRQMDFIRKKDIGYNRDQMLIINNTSQLGTHLDAFRQQLLQMSGIKSVAASGFLPVNYNRSSDSFFSDASLSTEHSIVFQKWVIDENYIPTMEMKMVQGRNFSKEMKTDSMGIILNEAAARFLGDKDIIGKQLYRIEDEATRKLAVYHVIGVVKDFNFSTFRDQVKPLSFIYGQDRGSLSVKMHSAQIPAVLSEIMSMWKSYSTELPFEYSFMDEEYNQQLQGEQKTGRLFSVFSVLAIFIACLGLFGLATFMAEQRTKEIGIRKVLGASVAGITSLMSRDFLKLILASLILAIPVTYFLMNQWLQEFAYRTQIGASVFVWTGCLIFCIAMLTISFQSIKSALANPVKSLRSDG